MKVTWTDEALLDLVRFQEFLESYPEVAARTIQNLLDVEFMLSPFPRIGTPLEQYAPAEVRKVFVGQYEIRYELTENGIFILHVWHTREDR